MFNDICVAIVNPVVNQNIEHWTEVNGVEGLFVVDEDDKYPRLNEDLDCMEVVIYDETVFSKNLASLSSSWLQSWSLLYLPQSNQIFCRL